MNPSSIPWQPVRTLPLTDGRRITVKTEDGELHNVTVCKGFRAELGFHENPIVGWIPNNEL